MASCSILTPFILLPDISNSQESLSNYLSIPPESFTLYALVPLSQAPTATEVALRLHTSTLSIQHIESLLHSKEQLQLQLEKCKETISTLKTQVLRKNNLYYDEKYMRRMEKLKRLNEDNKKLRELLRVQLENSESLRKETQSTVEVLREEFERLATEINKTSRPVKSVIKVPQMKIKDLKQR